MVTASRIERRQLSRDIYEMLRDRILTHDLGPGQPLLVRELARELGVSTTPVRDAVNLLAAEGLVAVHPRRGTLVKPFSITDVREFYEVRLLIEPPAAELAATGLSTDELTQLERLLTELESAPRHFTDTRAFIAHLTKHATFHSLIVRGARNERLLALHTNLAHYLIISRSIYPAGNRGQTDRPYEHREIVAALRRRDGPAARRAVEVHLVRAAEDILRYLAHRPAVATTGDAAADTPHANGDAEIDSMALARLDVLTGRRRSWRAERS